MRALGLVLLGSLLACSRAPSSEANPDAGAGESAVSVLDRARTLARPEALFHEVIAAPGFDTAFSTGDAAAFGARAPRFADGAWAVHAQKHDPITLRTPLAAREGTLVDGKVVYRDVAESTDLVVSSVVDRLELFYVLRDASAPRRFTINVEGATPRADGDAVMLEGADLRVPQPWAIDKNGVRRRANMIVEGSSISIGLDTDGLAFPILLDPAVDQVSWQDVTPVRLPTYDGTSTPARITPPAGFSRTLGSAAYALRGAGDGVVYLFGGTYYVNSSPPYAFASTLYEWNGTAWTSAGAGPSFPAGPTPLTRRVGGLTFDTARKRLVYIGGLAFGPTGTHITAREYDVVSKSWVGSVCDDGSPCYDTMPATGSTPSVAYAFGRTIVVYAGGTYWWDPTTSKLVKWSLPTDLARSGAGLAYDVNRNRLVAFGGDGGQNRDRRPRRAVELERVGQLHRRRLLRHRVRRRVWRMQSHRQRRQVLAAPEGRAGQGLRDVYLRRNEHDLRDDVRGRLRLRVERVLQRNLVHRCGGHWLGVHA